MRLSKARSMESTWFVDMKDDAFVVFHTFQTPRRTMNRSSFLSTSWLLRASKKISAASRRKKMAFQRAYMSFLLCSSLSISVGRKSRSSAAVARGDTCDSAAPDSAVRALPPSGVPESRMIVPRGRAGSRVGDEIDVGRCLKVIYNGSGDRCGRST